MSQLENEYQYYKSRKFFWTILKYLFLIIFLYAIFNLCLHVLIQYPHSNVFGNLFINIYNIFERFILVPLEWNFSGIDCIVYLLIFAIPYLFCVFKEANYSKRLANTISIINQAHNELKKEELKNKYRK